MKKLLPLSIAALSLLSLSSLLTAPAQAATVGSGFNVTVNLTSTCVVNLPATTLDFGAYTAFGASAPTPTATVTFKCTQGFSPSAVQFDTVPALSTASAAGASATGGGVIAGLLYGLSVAAPSNTAGAAATTTAGAGADIKTYTVTGSMAAGQAGSGAGGAATQARTLTITY